MSEYLTPEQYLPHRPPMCLIDRVVRIDGKTVVCETKACLGGRLDLFRNPDESVSTTPIIELMAQTVGVWAGERRIRLKQSERPEDEQDAPLGLLLSVRGLKILVDAIDKDAVLTMTMQLLVDESRLTSFEGTVTMNGIPAARGRLTVFQPTNGELKDLFPAKPTGETPEETIDNKGNL